MSEKKNKFNKPYKDKTRSTSISGINADDYDLLIENNVNVSGVCKNAIKKEADKIRNEA